MRGCSYHHSGSFPNTCEPCRLESRIAALTAELEQARDPMREQTWAERFRVLTERAELAEADLATERAAREKAEAERERIHRLWQDDEARGMAREAHLQSERDTALARVKELETELDAALDGMANETTARVAAESALASARELIERARAWLAWPTPAEPGPEPAACLLNALESWLSSAPSPAPCSGCAAARELLVLWYHNRSETESGELIEVETQNWLKEHGNG